MNEEEKQAFQKLSIFQGGFKREGAEKAANASLAVLSSLMDKSLLKRNLSGRYEIHEALRQFASRKLDEEPEGKEKTVTGFYKYYTDFLSQRERGLLGKNQKKVTQELSEEIGNLQAGWQLVLEKGSEEEIEKWIEPFFRYHMNLGLWADGKRLFELALDLAQRKPDANQRVYGKLLARQGTFYRHLGDYQCAEKLTQKALSIAQNLNEQTELALCLNVLAGIAMYTKDMKQAAQLFEECLAIYRRIGDRYWEARVLNNLGNVYSNFGELERARKLYQESLDIARKIGDLRDAAIGLAHLAGCCLLEGNHELAEKTAQESLEISKEISDPVVIASGLGMLGEIYIRNQNYEKGEQFLKESLTIFKDLGYRQGVTDCLEMLSKTKVQKQEYAEAEILLLEDLMVQQDAKDLLNASSILVELGDLAYLQDQCKRSLGFYYQAMEAAMKINFITSLIRTLSGLAVLFWESGEIKKTCQIVSVLSGFPAPDEKTKEKISELSRKIQSQISPDELKEMQEKAVNTSIEDLAEEILRKDIEIMTGNDENRLAK